MLRKCQEKFQIRAISGVDAFHSHNSLPALAQRLAMCRLPIGATIYQLDGETYELIRQHLRGGL